jgi:hypothetical protein
VACAKQHGFCLLAELFSLIKLWETFFFIFCLGWGGSHDIQLNAEHCYAECRGAMGSEPGANVIKHFTAVIYDFSL